MKKHRYSLLLFVGLLLAGWFVQRASVIACEHCPVSIDSRPSVQLGWSPRQAEVCDVLTVPEVFEIPHSRWGLGVAVDDTGGVFFTEYKSRPYSVKKLFPNGYVGTWATRENNPLRTMIQIEEMSWDPIHKVMWGASRMWITDTTFDKKRVPFTRIYTIKFDQKTAYAECTFRFQGLGVPGPNYPTIGLTFDPYLGPHGTIWQHIADGTATYTPFPLTADLGTTGPGEPVYVGGYPGYGQVSGICVSPSGKYMYVSQGIDGYISIHEKLTGAYVASLATGPRIQKRYLRGLEIDYTKPGCPKLLCTESVLSEPANEWTPTILVTYPITDE